MLKAALRPAMRPEMNARPDGGRGLRATGHCPVEPVAYKPGMLSQTIATPSGLRPKIKRAGDNARPYFSPFSLRRSTAR